MAIILKVVNSRHHHFVPFFPWLTVDYDGAASNGFRLVFIFRKYGNTGSGLGIDQSYPRPNDTLRLVTAGWKHCFVIIVREWSFVFQCHFLGWWALWRSSRWVNDEHTTDPLSDWFACFLWLSMYDVTFKCLGLDHATMGSVVFAHHHWSLDWQPAAWLAGIHLVSCRIQ